MVVTHESSACICREMVSSFLKGVAPPSLRDSVVLDLGCGMRKMPGSIGIDRRPSPVVDCLYDLDDPKWPIRDGSVDVVWANQVIEHVADAVAFLDKIHACLRPGGDVVLLTPHYSSPYAWSDPTHRRAFGILSMDYASTYLPGKYEIVHRF